MELLLFIIRLVLAAIFATAAVAKFIDLKGSEKAFRDFGVPAVLALPGSIALSIAEAVIAVGLLFPETSWYSSVAAAALLLLFIVQMTYQRIRGNAPDCHCFGQLHSEPVGIRSILRNCVFLALAMLPVMFGRGRQGLALGQIDVSVMPVILGTTALIMLGAALLMLRKVLQTQDQLRRRLEVLELVSAEGAAVEHEHATDPNVGLPIGAPLPEYALTSLDGRSITTRQLAMGRPALFLFVSPTCEPCQALLPDFVRWREEMSERVSMIFVTSGTEKQNRKKFEAIAGDVYIDEDRKFAFSVGGRWTPTALYVNAEGRIAGHIAAGDNAIEELIEKLRSKDVTDPLTHFPNSNGQPVRLRIGSRVPEFTLPLVGGAEFSNSDLVGRRTLVAFWSPTCPHCEALLDDLKKWESARSNGDPSLVLMSDGDLEAHLSLGFSSPVVMDKGYKVAGKLGMLGTPSAVIVGENGVIETETAVGADNIWALLGRTDGAN